MRRERCLAASETFVNYGIWCCVQCNKSKREFFFCLLLTLIGKSQFVGKMSGCGHKHPAKAFSSSIRRRRHSDKHVLELNRGQPDLIPHLDMSMPMPPITPPAAFLLPSLNRSTVKAPSSRASSSKGKGESQRFTLDGMASTDLVEVTFVASIVACVENQNNKDTSSCSWSSKIFYSIDVGIHDNYNTKNKRRIYFTECCLFPPSTRHHWMRFYSLPSPMIYSHSAPKQQNWIFVALKFNASVFFHYSF